MVVVFVIDLLVNLALQLWDGLEVVTCWVLAIFLGKIIESLVELLVEHSLTKTKLLEINRLWVRVVSRVFPLLGERVTWRNNSGFRFWSVVCKYLIVLHEFLSSCFCFDCSFRLKRLIELSMHLLVWVNTYLRVFILLLLSCQFSFFHFLYSTFLFDMVLSTRLRWTSWFPCSSLLACQVRIRGDLRHSIIHFTILLDTDFVWAHSFIKSCSAISILSVWIFGNNLWLQSNSIGISLVTIKVAISFGLLQVESALPSRTHSYWALLLLDWSHLESERIIVVFILI
jgi:hypothetical protein